MTSMTRKINPITNVQISKIDQDTGAGKLKAKASVRFGGIILKQLKVIDGDDRLFVAMPSELIDDGQGHRDVIHPITKHFRELLESTVLYSYAKGDNFDDEYSDLPDETVLTAENALEITGVKIRYIAENPSDTLKACFSVTIADSLVIHSVKLLAGEDGKLYVIMPTFYDKVGGLYHDLVKFVSLAIEEKFSEAIINVYHKYQLLSTIEK